MAEKLAFDSLGLDVWRELCNVGVSNAAIAISKMTGKMMYINVPSCKLVTYDEMGRAFGDPEKIVSSILVQLNEDIEGYIMFSQELGNAIMTQKLLTGIDVSGSIEDIEKLAEELSPLEELVNIMISAFVGSMSTMTGLKINPSVPSLCIDMLMAVMNIPAVVYGEVSEEVLMIETQFVDSEIKGHFFLLPDYKSYKKLIEMLCV